MRNRKLSNEQLIDAVEKVSPDTTLKEIESLILQICTRIKNDDTLPPKALQSGYREWEHVLLEIYRNLRRRKQFTNTSPKTLRKLSMNISLPIPPGNDSPHIVLEVVQSLLPKVIQKFTPGRPEYSGAKESKEYCDYWFEIPGSPNQYASVGISKKDDLLYWCAPKPAAYKLKPFLSAGYYEDGKELYKDFTLPLDFCKLSTSQQEHWFINYISEQLNEYESLEQTEY